MTTDDPSVEPLTFRALDGVALALRYARLQRLAARTYQFDDLGPWLELHHLRKAGHSLDAGPQFIGPTNGRLTRALQGQTLVNASMGGGIFVLRPVATALDEEMLAPLGLAAQTSATSCRIPKRAMLSIISALKEMFDNVFEHSESPETGVAAVCAKGGSFEFVVADEGIGVLQSLRRSPNYSTLATDGEALVQAIRPNVTRFSAEPGRGHGFDRLVTGMANMNAELRFRSGDAILHMSGVGQAQPQPIVSPSVHVPGFVITAKFHALRKA